MMQEQWRGAVAPQLLTRVDDRATRLALALQSGHGAEPRQELRPPAVLCLDELGQHSALNDAPPSAPHTAHGDYGGALSPARPRGAHAPGGRNAAGTSLAGGLARRGCVRDAAGGKTPADATFAFNKQRAERAWRAERAERAERELWKRELWKRILSRVPSSRDLRVSPLVSSENY